MEKALFISQLQVLFFGDSLRSDIFPSQTFSEWRSVMIFEEILLESPSTKNDSENENTKKVKLYHKVSM